MQNLAQNLARILALKIGTKNGGFIEEWEKLFDKFSAEKKGYSNGDCRFFRYINRDDEKYQGWFLFILFILFYLIYLFYFYLIFNLFNLSLFKNLFN